VPSPWAFRAVDPIGVSGIWSSTRRNARCPISLSSSIHPGRPATPRDTALRHEKGRSQPC
jgi:hypothetical protein